jgi:catalase
MPIADDQNSRKAGPRGPTILKDFHLREKIFHFDHERIPERVVHARGFGAHGYFENYGSLADLTRSDLFQRAKDKDASFRKILNRSRQQGFGGSCARRARVCG